MNVLLILFLAKINIQIVNFLRTKPHLASNVFILFYKLVGNKK